MARPKLAPTQAQRRLVRVSAGAGLSHEQIAISLELSRSSLERHFAHELTVGAYRCRIDVVVAMFAAAKRGSAAAQKAYLARTPQVAAPPLFKLGKKAQANADAPTAQHGTEWEALLGKGKTLQ
jgi:hypothetical protein